MPLKAASIKRKFKQRLHYESFWEDVQVHDFLKIIWCTCAVGCNFSVQFSCPL